MGSFYAVSALRGEAAPVRAANQYKTNIFIPLIVIAKRGLKYDASRDIAHAKNLPTIAAFLRSIPDYALFF
jgi:hypothetical protein